MPGVPPQCIKVSRSARDHSVAVWGDRCGRDVGGAHGQPAQAGFTALAPGLGPRRGPWRRRSHPELGNTAWRCGGIRAVGTPVARTASPRRRASQD